MAIEMETCYTDQTATVKKLLDDDWEPFAAFPIRVKKDGETTTRIKMYFRKMPEPEIVDLKLEPLEPIKLDLAPLFEAFTDALSAFFDQTKRDNDRLTNLIGELLEETKKNNQVTTEVFAFGKHEQLLRSGKTEVESPQHVEYKVGDPYPKPEPLRDDPEPITRKEIAGATKVEVDESEPVERGGPEGDGFRVVQDVPPEAVSNSARTAAQDTIINELRNRYGNISVFNAPNGEVKVLANEWIYMIKPDGTTVEEKTNANTNSLTV